MDSGSRSWRSSSKAPRTPCPLRPRLRRSSCRRARKRASGIGCVRPAWRCRRRPRSPTSDEVARLRSHFRGGRSASRGATRISHVKTSSASRSVSSASTRQERASAKFSAGVSGLSNNRSRPRLETHPRLVTHEMKAEAFASCYANVIRSFKPSDRLAASAALVSCAAGHECPHGLHGKRQ